MSFPGVQRLFDIPAYQLAHFPQPACLAVFPRTTASYSDGGLSREPSRVLCLVAA